MELTPIKPGTFLNKIKIEKKELCLSQDRIRVLVPARVHLSVIDMNYFSPGQPGGGGVGYAVRLYAEVEISLLDKKDYNIQAKREGVVRHIAHILAKSVGYQGGFEIKAKDHNINHMGLGSTSALITAVACGINKLLGEPLESRSLRKIIGYNFAEDAENGLVVPGFETGVGPAAGIHGGFVLLTDGLELVARCPLERCVVYLAFLKEDVAEEKGGEITQSKNAGELEAELLLNKAREFDKRDAHKKTHQILFKLLPSMMNNDLEGMGEAVWNLQHLGSKVAEIEHHTNPEKIYEVMRECRKRGASIVGMSSVGPAITIVCREKKEIKASVEGYLNKEEVRYIKTGVDNQGIKVEKI